jgi:hypothetical protein
VFLVFFEAESRIWSRDLTSCWYVVLELVLLLMCDVVVSMGG